VSGPWHWPAARSCSASWCRSSSSRAPVYLPTLAWLARTGDRARAIGLLLLYNLAFILPLLAVFAASYTGVSSSRIASSFQRHRGKVKIGPAVVFAGLAEVTLVA
jgi:cytochrome c biogenesis protein CcdA